MNLPVANTDKISAIGYCFGGLSALDMARSGAPLKGVVSFHGFPRVFPEQANALFFDLIQAVQPAIVLSSLREKVDRLFQLLISEEKRQSSPPAKQNREASNLFSLATS